MGAPAASAPGGSPEALIDFDLGPISWDLKRWLPDNPVVALWSVRGKANADDQRRSFNLMTNMAIRRSSLEKFRKLRHAERKTLSDLTSGLLDNLIASNPERIRTARTDPDVRKILTWAFSLGLYNVQHAISEWKKFCTLLKHRALQSETPWPEPLSDFPGFGRDACPDCPALWARLCPWLKIIWSQGASSKSDMTRICHLATSRNLPTASAAEREKTLLSHASVLTSTPIPDIERSSMLRMLSRRIGEMVKGKRKGRSSGHCSLAQSACIEQPAGKGGRAFYIQSEFQTWASRKQTETISETTWFGQPFRLKEGLPMWVTMCRTEDASNPTMAIGESRQDFNMNFDDFRHEDFLAGLDKATGYQLLQWSLEEGIRRGCLLGDPFRSSSGLAISKEKLPEIKADIVGEPGGKSRVMTIGEGWLTIFLQPASHHLAGLIEHHEAAWAGFKRGWQASEWAKRYRRKQHWTGEDYVLSSDLKTATDYCRHDFSLSLLLGFLEGSGQGDNPYLRAAAELLCSPRYYTGPVEGSIGPTSRGILMGDPGSKIVLTLFNLAAEEEAFVRWATPRMIPTISVGMVTIADSATSWKIRNLAVSGDDHTARGPKSYLKGITQAHIANGMEVSESSNFLSPIGGFYCEEALLFRGLDLQKLRAYSVPFWDIPYLEHMHVDSLKLRCLSPVMKGDATRDEKNPAIGKASTFTGMLRWFAGGWACTRPIFSARFEQRFKTFLPEGILRYLPRELGGVAAPCFHLTAGMLESSLTKLDPSVRSAINLVLAGERGELAKLLAKIPANTSMRGIPENLARDQVTQILETFPGVQGRIDESQLKAMADDQMGDQWWGDATARDRARFARRNNLISVVDALNDIERPYLFREFLAPGQHAVHEGPSQFKTRIYDTTPWPVRVNRFRSLALSAKPDLLDHHHSAEGVSDGKLVGMIQKGKGLPPPPRMYIPERVIFGDDLVTLQTPL